MLFSRCVYVFRAWPIWGGEEGVDSSVGGLAERAVDFADLAGEERQIHWV